MAISVRAALFLRDSCVDWGQHPIVGHALHRDNIAHAHLVRAARFERHVLRAPRRRLYNGVERALEFVGETLARHTGEKDCPVFGGPVLELTTRSNNAVATAVAPDSHVNLLEDVAAHGELAELLLPPLAERPCGRPDAISEPQPLDVLEASNEKRLIDASGVPPRTRLHPGRSVPGAQARSPGL